MYQKILVPLDGSKQAEAALLLASKLARIYNAEILLLRVVEYPFEMYSQGDSDNFVLTGRPEEKRPAEKDAFCKEAEGYLKHLASMVEMGVSKVSIKIQERPVVEAILNTVVNAEVDLIVMSTIGQDHNAWMLGAITNRILREAPVPIILIRKESWVPEPSYGKAAEQKESGIHSPISPMLV
ncbi:MAG TPA: universal stress protein [Anaerolineales bacterium]|nr:universal stress protein [Anaerolineales bacterium]